MPRQQERPQKILVRTYVRPDLAKRFHEQFPGHGSLSWLLERAMLEVLSLTDGQPPLKDVVRSAIRSAVLRERLINRSTDVRPANDSASADLTVERIAP